MFKTGDPLVVVICGLPACGKTYIASKLTRYLTWKGHKTKLFKTGEYRQKLNTDLTKSHVYYDHTNKETSRLRSSVVNACLDDLLEWISNEGNTVGIFDGSNLSRSWRSELQTKLQQKVSNIKVFYIDSTCDNEAILEANLKEITNRLPDYKDMKECEAISDFKQRIEHDRLVYEPLDIILDKQLSFLKMYNINQSITANRVEGYLVTRIVHFLMNIHVIPRSIYLSRHGESIFNLKGLIGGDSGLSERGHMYTKLLYKYIRQEVNDNLQVWTSTMVRTIETGMLFADEIKTHWKCLEEINAGSCDGLTYKQIEERYPDEFEARKQNKYFYRYPRGESYHDIVVRLEPVMMELERAHNVLVIGHQAVLRCVLAYFLDKTTDQLPYIKVPLHSVIKITPLAYGCLLETINFPIEAVQTYIHPPDKK